MKAEIRPLVPPRPPRRPRPRPRLVTDADEQIKFYEIKYAGPDK